MTKTTLFILLYITIGVFLTNIATDTMEKKEGRRIKPALYILLVISWPIVFYYALLTARKRKK